MATDYTPMIKAAQQSVTYTDPTPNNAAVYNAELNNGTSFGTVAQQIVNDNYTTANVDPVIALYQAAYGRVPDAGGLKFEVQSVEAGLKLAPSSAQDTNNLVFTFASSPEFQARYGVTATSTNSSALVYLLYQNVLGRAPDAAGLAYWTAQPLNAQQLLAAFALPNLDPEYANRVSPQVKSFEYDETGASGSQAVPTTGSLFQVQINAGSTSGSTAAGQTFNLTGTASDVYTLNNADATHKTTNLGDTFFLNTTPTIANPLAGQPTGTIIQDGTGPNTLNITGFGNTNYTPTQISNVQTINITSTNNNATFNAANVTGTNVINDLKSANSLTITNLAGSTAVGISGETANHTDTVTYVAGTTTANIVLGADGGAGGHNINLVLGTGATNSITTDSFVSNGANQVTLTTADAALTTINHSGSAAFTLTDAVDTGLKTLSDTSTGASTFTLGAAAAGAAPAVAFVANSTISLGAGADTVTAFFNGTGHTVTTGAGADSLSLTYLNAAGAATATAEVQVASINAGTGADTFTLTSNFHNAITLTAGAGADTINMTANAAHNVTVGAGSDTFNINFNHTGGGTGNLVATGYCGRRSCNNHVRCRADVSGDEHHWVQL